VLAGVAIVLVAVAAFLPGLAGLDWVLVDRPWTLLPPPAPVAVPLVVVVALERPLALRSLLPPRAPPSPSA
jgi:hypothetical protein